MAESGPDMGQSASDQSGEPSFGMAAMSGNDKKVRAGFWTKLARFAARIPFAEDAIAAYYCAMDSRTPPHVRAVLLGALAYFIMPLDLIPDIIAGLGFTDDATVLATALALVARHITPEHRRRAAECLQQKDLHP